ncbi:MAG: K+-dependent Na+/Ca+ exchanger related-protein [uncultured Sulfurovum sp.]|uniref:K+-dependent Na+/Ca+ exchanger related-protein n=1 Tax=uncultured Sulfurovum sp. TaxID=269237 RepID=A0A6S6SPC2_9BACT|nr:MAG: K+-dependent Na+/Ca+ exchanger related-protein [uncultured Sulfurovum sp.]
MDFVIFILAMGGLIFGADFIVNQSERIALRFNISEFIIGSTLIALGTSLPEMAASMAASFDNKSEIAIANAVGSNIMNITLVLAVIFILSKPSHWKETRTRDFFSKDSIWALMPILIFLLMAIDGEIGKFDASLLFLLMFAYLLFLLQDARNDEVGEVDQDLRKDFSWFGSISLLILGFIMVVLGANFAIDSASNIATSFGVSEWLIGVVVLAFGTSLPELIVSITAVIKGKVAMAIGNIIGSNLANTTMVIGGAAMINNLDISLKIYSYDLAIMTVATIMLIYITANKLYSKPAGISLLIVLSLFLYEKVYPAIPIIIPAS